MGIQQAHQLGARRVPLHVINNTYGLSGAQSVEQFLAAFDQASRR